MPASLTLRSQSELTFASINPSSSKPCTSSLAACHLKPRSLPRQASQLAIRIYFIFEFFWVALRAPRKNRKPIVLGLPLFVCMRFQDLFHSPPGVLFAFPSRYWFTIGRLRVFSLGGWSPHLQTGFHVSRPTCRNPSSTPQLSRTGLSPTMAGLSRPF